MNRGGAKDLNDIFNGMDKPVRTPKKKNSMVDSEEFENIERVPYLNDNDIEVPES